MALTLLAANNAQTVLAAGISSSATSITVNTGTGALFPAPVSGTSYFKLTLVDAATGSLTEIVHVTARTGDVMTIQRGQEGTTARAWSANDIAANMMTAGTLLYILNNYATLESPSFTGIPIVPTAAPGTSDSRAASTAFVAAAINAATGRLINIQRFTSSGTYTPTQGTKAVDIYVVGAGGAGGGSQATTSTTVSVCPGGNAGCFARSYLTSGFSGQLITVGTGGTGVLGANGNPGGASSFGSLITAPGGVGGITYAPNSSPVLNINPTTQTNATGGNIVNATGGRGQPGVASGLVYGGSGEGGSSVMGSGGATSGVLASPTNGKPGVSPGSGGSGGAGSSGAAASTGGKGADGLVIVMEYA